MGDCMEPKSRMSCGLESAEDLIADIAQALDKV